MKTQARRARRATSIAPILVRPRIRALGDSLRLGAGEISFGRAAMGMSPGGRPETAVVVLVNRGADGAH